MAAQPRFFQVNPSEGAKAATIVRQSDAFKAFMKNLEPSYSAEAGAVVFGEASRIVVAIPVAYKGQHEGTSFTAVLDRKTLKVISQTALKIASTTTEHHAQIWQDGNLVADFTGDDKGTVLTGWAFDGQTRKDISGQNFVDKGKAALDEFVRGFEEPTPSKFRYAWGGVANADIECVNGCLANAGVGWFLITTLGIACGFICLGTAGVLCYPCMYAYAGGLGGLLMYCLRLCGYRF